LPLKPLELRILQCKRKPVKKQKLKWSQTPQK